METKAKTYQKHLLLVDDNALNLLSLEAMLKVRGNGWRVVTATDGLIALDEFERQHFDLVVTDYQMPGMNGLVLLEAVRQKSPETPVIMISAHDCLELREQARVLFRKRGDVYLEDAGMPGELTFAVDLCADSSPSQVVVARIEGEASLGAAVERMGVKIQDVCTQ